jgi:EmrB/QacA subfamily drug resistance transporter
MARRRLSSEEEGRRWWIVAAMGVSLGIVLLDEVMVGVALPTIRDELGLSQVLAQWVVNAYVLALTAFVAAGGRLGDLFGHRPVFITGATIVAAGSLAAGLAESGGWLLASRAVQGLGTATILSLSIAMIGIAFPERERGKAIGTYGLIAAILAAIGPFLGGLLTDAASWRWIFFLNVPMLAAVIAIVALAWRDPKGATARASLDLRGLAVLLVVLVPLVIALMQSPEWGWGSTEVIALIAVSAAALPIFISIERRVANPLIQVGLLRAPTVVGSNLVIFSAQFSKLAVLVFGATYLQDTLDMSPLQAGTALLAALVPTLLTARLSGALTDRYGPRTPTLAGVASTVVALVWLTLVTPAESYLLMLPGLMLWGVSLSFLFNPSYTAVLNSVAAEQRGEASGVTTSGRMLGGTLAVAVLGAVLVSTGSFSAVFAIAAGVTAAVWVAAYLLIDHPARKGARVAAPRVPVEASVRPALERSATGPPTK